MMDSGVYFAEGTMFFISLRSSGSRPGQIPANILRRVAMFCEIQQSSSNLSKFPSPRRARKYTVTWFSQPHGPKLDLQHPPGDEDGRPEDGGQPAAQPPRWGDGFPTRLDLAGFRRGFTRSAEQVISSPFRSREGRDGGWRTALCPSSRGSRSAELRADTASRNRPVCMVGLLIARSVGGLALRPACMSFLAARPRRM